MICSCSKDDLPSGDINLEIFPNPTSGAITIMVETPGVYNIEIAKVSNGKIVYTNILNGMSTNIDLSTFANGFYWIKVSIDDL